MLMCPDEKRARVLVELVGGAARVLQAQLGVQVVQLLITAQQKAAHLRLCLLANLRIQNGCQSGWHKPLNESGSVAFKRSLRKDGMSMATYCHTQKGAYEDKGRGCPSQKDSGGRRNPLPAKALARCPATGQVDSGNLN